MMRINKLFGARSITNLLYGLIMFLPFMAILGRVIYTQSNPNAKDSYTGSVSYLTTQNLNTFLTTSQASVTTEKVVNGQTTYQVTNYNLGGEMHSINYTADTLTAWTSYGSTTIKVEGLNVDNVDYSNIKTISLYRYNNLNMIWLFETEFNVDTMYFQGDNSFSYAILRDANGQNIERSTNCIQLRNNTQIYTHQIRFVNVVNDVFYRITNAQMNMLEKNIFYTDNTLSNSFEYSIDMFVNNNANINNINFFGWFNGLFLNQSNTHNMLYLNFANWYMNYALLVSSGYLLFLALMWFINYVRRILDKSQNIDFGGF